MLRALITTSAEEEWWAAFWRRFILVVSTWMTGHIYVLLSEIGQAVDMHTQTAEDGGGGGAAAADGSSSSASAPRRKAGFSCPRVGPEAVDQAAHSWSSLGADNFRVRCGPNYKRNGFKEPSGPALGEVVAVDTLRTEKKVFDFLSQGHIELPQGSPDWSEVYPEFVVVNQMMPVEFNGAFVTGADTDGATLHLVLYIRLRPGLGGPGWSADMEPANAEQLLKRFVLRADQDPGIAHCFKEIGVVRNLDAAMQKLPAALQSLVRKFNGKPILTRPEHVFHRDPQNRYFAADLDAHRYQYFTRSSLSKAVTVLDQVNVGFGYVVEARKEPELPEVMMCCCELLKLDPKRFALFPPAAAS